MSTTTQAVLSLVARILLSTIFLLSGLMKVANWAAVADMMAAHGMPAIPFFLTLATIIEIAGGLALLLGYQTRAASLILFLYLIPVTLVMHNFWAAPAPEQQNQIINFLKNLAILGGLLEFCAAGAGAYSLDATRSRAGQTRQASWSGLRRPV